LVSEQISFSLALSTQKMAHCAIYIRLFQQSWGEVFQSMHKVSDSVRSTHGQDGAIVLDIQQGQMFNLNLVGSRILELLESGSTDEQIVDVISREFSADIETVRKDVAEFLEELKAHKLLAAAAPSRKF
jgi:hypothetical protein